MTNREQSDSAMPVVAILVGLYLAAIVAANLIAARFGPTASIYNAFALIGFDLITRDRLADFWGTTRWAKMALLILTGALLSYLATPDAHMIAEASAISFACAETGEGLLYHLLRKRRWMQRANIAAWLGAAIDSFVFPTLAFGGVIWSTTAGQFIAKTAGALLWSLLIARVRVRQRTEAVT
jgi:queuosine precursor transporter